MKKVFVYTLGCKLNQFESAGIAEEFKKLNYEITQNYKDADVIVLNTCTVTSTADAKSRKYARRFARENPDAVIIITGCFATLKAEEISQMIPDVSALVDNTTKPSIPFIVESGILKPASHPSPPQIFTTTYSKSDTFKYDAGNFLGKTRAFLKIQDGCNRMCSYCIVPFARGRSRSLNSREVIKRFSELIARGFKEVVLTGVDISDYNDGNLNLSKLVRKLLEIKGDFRIRLSSLEPDNVDDELINLISHPKLAPHLHLSLQSGSNKVLEDMKRGYSTDDFMRVVEKARKINPDIGITTDIIVGFPTETDKDFEQTLRIIKDVGFVKVHTFVYSPRYGTSAYRLGDRIPADEKKRRSEEVRKTAEESAFEIGKKFVGKTMKVLVEGFDGDHFYGLSGNYIWIGFKEPVPKGEFVNALIMELGSGKDGLWAKATPNGDGNAKPSKNSTVR